MKAFSSILLCTLGASIAQAEITWDGEAGDGLWSSPSNWNPDGLPSASDEVSVGATVTAATADFATLTIESGASVDFSTDNVSSKVLNIGGTLSFSGAFRPKGSTLNFSSTGVMGSGINWIDLGTGAVLSFDDGASFGTSSTLEMRGATTLGFTLSDSGFDTLNLGALWDSGIAGWSEITVNLDVSDYDIVNGSSVVLMDFSNVVGDFTGDFNPVVNVVAGESGLEGELSFDSGSGQLLYSFAEGPLSWDGEAGDGLWSSALNWMGDAVPTNADDVLVAGSAVVTGASTDFKSLEIGQGASVSFASYFPSSKLIKVHGTLDLDTNSAFRPYGCELEFSATGKVGSNLGWLDIGTNSHLKFTDGASFDVASTVEVRGATTLDFTFSETGFSTLALGGLADGGTLGWSDFTMNVDLSEYDTSNGLSVVLIDFSNHATDFDGTFNPTVNVIDGGTGIGAALSFDTSTSQLVATIDAAGNDAPVASGRSYAYDGENVVNVTLVASDIEGDELSYSIVSNPNHGSLSGTAPNLVYTFTGDSPAHDSFSFKVNDGVDDSNVATVSISYTPQTSSDMWVWLQDKIENDPLNTATVTTWTEPHSDGSGDTITISRITYELGTLTGSQHTANPVIAAYYARPTGASNLPGLLQNHGGGQRAQSVIPKFWAEQGYAAISINWGGLHLSAANPDEPAPAEGEVHPNTDWDGIAGGFTRVSTDSEPLENPVTEAIFWAAVDPATFSDGQTLFDIPHPMNSSWTLNGYAVRRAITFLQSQAEVDDSKIGVLGWSMGGRTTMMSSTDPRITVLAPAVGGTGYLYEDFWGLPGTARHSTGWQDIELFKNAVADQSYWPHVSVPVLFLNGSNDFNAPFDLATKSLSIHEVGLGDVSPNNRLVTDPHYNHRVTDSSLAARVHWMRHHLKGDIDFPETSDSELEWSSDDGVPRFRVFPDSSTSFSIVSVDVYYGTDRDSRTRFWRHAEAIDQGSHWEAALPVFDVEEMMVAHAVITYDVGFSQDVPFGSPTEHLTIASKVHTYYPSGVDDDYSLPDDLDTAIHQIHVLDPDALLASGVKETAEISEAIDDPSASHGFRDWFVINGSNSQAWQFHTRKISDICYRGGVGATFQFDLTADAENTLVVRLVADDWNGGSSNTYMAYVPITIGLNEVELELSDFKLADGTTELGAWSQAKFIGFGAEQTFNLGASAWTGSVPTIAQLSWSGGEHTLEHGVTTSWLDTYGYRWSNDALLDDADGDGQANWEEFITGTIPSDAFSVFRVTTSSSENGDFVIQWPAVSGKSYSIDHSFDLSNEGWDEIATGHVADEAIESVSIELNPEDRKGFFRVRVE